MLHTNGADPSNTLLSQRPVSNTNVYKCQATHINNDLVHPKYNQAQVIYHRERLQCPAIVIITRTW